MPRTRLIVFARSWRSPMTDRIPTLRKHLMMAAELVDRYPDLMPLLERVERDYDTAVPHGTTLARIKAKLESADDD
jgi:hypothetical protein